MYPVRYELHCSADTPSTAPIEALSPMPPPPPPKAPRGPLPPPPLGGGVVDSSLVGPLPPEEGGGLDSSLSVASVQPASALSVRPSPSLSVPSAHAAGNGLVGGTSLLVIVQILTSPGTSVIFPVTSQLPENDAAYALFEVSETE